MESLKTIVWRFRRVRAAYRRRVRLLYPSPAEVKFIRLMGGRVVVVDWIHNPRNKYPLVIVLSLGRILRRQGFRREVRIGSKFVDFGNDLKYVIEIDGRPFHDIVEMQRRDDYLANYECQVLHIPAAHLWRSPDKVQRRVVKFLTY